eukprot:15446520-Alexandrium_andersonii.AAC.1
MSGEFSSMNWTSTSGRAHRSSRRTAGSTMRWTESLPASPMRPSPRPMVENCWQGDPATTSRMPPHGALSTTLRSLAPR